MVKAVIYFDDLENTVRNFYKKHFDPAMFKNQKQIKKCFIPYQLEMKGIKSPRSIPDVIKDTVDLIEQCEFNRIAFLVDLSPSSQETPDLTYGLKVVKGLSAAIMPGTSPLNKSLTSNDHLIVIITNFGGRELENIIPKEWININNLKIIKKNNNKPNSERVAMTLSEIKKSQNVPHVIISNKIEDDHWIAETVVAWF